VPTREGGHKVKVGDTVPLHFQNRSGAYEQHLYLFLSPLVNSCHSNSIELTVQATKYPQLFWHAFHVVRGNYLTTCFFESLFSILFEALHKNRPNLSYLRSQISHFKTKIKAKMGVSNALIAAAK